MSRERIEQIYNWLKGKPCGSKTLYDYLKIKGVTLEEQDIAVLALTIDILNGVVKPEGNPEVIKNSLYALSQASEFFGHKLYPVIIDFNSRTTQLSNSITPFIAHFKGDHYILVSRISDEKVYFIDEHKEEFLPKEKFLEEFSGYALIDAKNPSSDTYQLLTDTQAKEVLGGRKDYTKYTRPADLSVYFKKPPLKDTLLSLGITVATSFIGAGGVKGSFSNFYKTMAISTISSASTRLAVTKFGWSPGAAQIFGYAVGGAMSGMMTTQDNSSLYKIATKNPENWWNNNPALRGAVMGSLKGAMQGGGNLLAYNAIKNTGFYKNNPFVAGQVANLFGGAAGYLGFNLVAGALHMQTSIDVSTQYKKKIAGKTPQEWGGGAQPSEPTLRIFSTVYKGALSSFKLALRDPSFQRYMISQIVALSIEYAIPKKYAQYSRLLGQSSSAFVTGATFKDGWRNIGSAVYQGALSGLSSYALSSLGGKFDRTTDKNRWGLTPVQMASIQWLGATAVSSFVDARTSSGVGSSFASAFKDRIIELAVNLHSFFKTSPAYTQGAGGWSEAQYIEKLTRSEEHTSELQ